MKKWNISKNKLLGVFTVVALIAVVSSLYVLLQSNLFVHKITFKPSESKSVRIIDQAAETAYWKERIIAKGVEQTYSEYIQSLTQLDTEGLKHLEGHTFGEALYATVGMKGASVCDARHLGGCMHAFFGSAIQDMGVTAAIKELSVLCAQQTSTQAFNMQCSHSVGHGILGYLGYTQDSLDKTLAMCEEFLPKNTVDNCAHGAFMEYNNRTLINVDNTDVRKFSEETAFSPCIESDKKFMEACMYWQPTWWYNNFFYQKNTTETTTDVFNRISELCKKFGVLYPHDASSCVIGAANLFIITSSTTDQVAEGCSLFETIQDRTTCWSFAVYRIHNTREAQKSENLVCQNLVGDERAQCLTNIRALSD